MYISRSPYNNTSGFAILPIKQSRNDGNNGAYITTLGDREFRAAIDIRLEPGPTAFIQT